MPYTGNGVTTSFSFPYYVIAAADLKVYKNGTLQTITTDYTLSGSAPYTSGTNVQFVSAPANADSIVIIRDPAITQPVDLVDNDPFDPDDSIETPLDRLTMICQRLSDLISRSFTLSDTDVSGASTVIPTPSATRLIGWNSDGTALQNYSTETLELALTTPFTLTLLDDADADSFTQTLFAALTAETTLATDDTVLIGDTSEAKGNKATLTNLIKTVGAYGLPINLGLLASVGSSALTVAVKGRDGNDPSASNAVLIPFRSSTSSSGVFNWRSVTSALSLTISSGSTLGHNSSLKQYIYWYLIDNSGTVELAASSKFFGNHGIVSTTAEGAAGAADSGTVMYSSTARTNVPFLCIGYTEDTQTTAGTWATAPSAIHLVPFTHPVISFSAHKNSTNQTGVPTGTFTKITYATELFDNGGLYDAATNYRWTPPPGTLTLTGAIGYSSGVDQASFSISIRKNGSDFRGARSTASGTDIINQDATIVDECNGTDYYEVFAYHEGGSDRTILGTQLYTYFMGVWSPTRS